MLYTIVTLRVHIGEIFVDPYLELIKDLYSYVLYLLLTVLCSHNNMQNSYKKSRKAASLHKGGGGRSDKSALI